MGLTAWLVLAGAVIFAGASFFFALAETALFALGKRRARQLVVRSLRPSAGQALAARVRREGAQRHAHDLGRLVCSGL